MLDRWYKISTIGVAVVIIVSAIVGPSIGGIIWLDRLDRDVCCNCKRTWRNCKRT